MDITKSLRMMNKDSSFLSYDFNSLYPSAEADEDSKWPAIETSFPFERFLSDAICELFNSSRWEEVNGSAFLTVKFHNPENLIFQHILTKEKLNNPHKRNRLEKINRSRNSIIIDTLNSFHIVEIVK